jgi:hypothetical protein
MPKGFYDRFSRIRPTVDRILEKIIKDEKTGCWNYGGYTDKKGYGRGYGDLKSILTHRYIYWFYKKRDKITWENFNKTGLLVCHSCDNPSCNNPDHLWEGTDADNMSDAVNKGRFPCRKGEKNGRSKLTKDQVLEILKSKEKITHIARRFNIGWTTIQYIKLGKTWSIDRGF